MSFLVDTSVWSLALRRDQPGLVPEVEALKSALQAGESIVTTGLALQEILQGFSGPRDRAKIIDRFSSLALLTPDRVDHLVLLSTDRDFVRVSAQTSLRLWSPSV